ncbi:hypothetical protein J6590_090508, partial [Homalodisca vitripennis]
MVLLLPGSCDNDRPVPYSQPIVDQVKAWRRNELLRAGTRTKGNTGFGSGVSAPLLVPPGEIRGGKQMENQKVL